MESPVENPAEIDDALLRAQAGGESGFRALWLSLQPQLRRYLQGLGCDDAEDVASETWLQAIRDLGRFSGAGTDFRSWLFTIGRHRALDAARSQARYRDKVQSLVPEQADWNPVEDEVLYRLSNQRAVTLLAGLSKDQSAAVRLRVIAGLDTDSTACMLGKSTGAIRVSLHRGLHKLLADPRIRASLRAGCGDG